MINLKLIGIQPRLESLKHKSMNWLMGAIETWFDKHGVEIPIPLLLQFEDPSFDHAVVAIASMPQSV